MKDVALYLKKDIGGRNEQQDSCAYLQNETSVFLILADGMGGHSGGYIASHTFIEEAKKNYELQSKTIKNPHEFFQQIIKNVQIKLKTIKDKNSAMDPHTTCVMALIQDGTLHVGHIGDSRMYLFIDNKFVRRSADHSVVQMLLIDGVISEEEMATHPDQNRLLKSIGAEKDIKITYNVYKIPKKSSCVVLLCSDGFWEQVKVDEMQNKLFSLPLNQAIDEMVEDAKKRGGEKGDNISVVACKYIKNSFRDRNKLLLSFLLIIFALLIFLTMYKVFEKRDSLLQTDKNVSMKRQTR